MEPGNHLSTTMTDLPEVHADHHSVVYNPYNQMKFLYAVMVEFINIPNPLNHGRSFKMDCPLLSFIKWQISTTNPPVLSGGSQDNGGFIRRANGSWGNTNGGDAMWQLIDPTQCSNRLF